jgi:hypothetical protein
MVGELLIFIDAGANNLVFQVRRDDVVINTPPDIVGIGLARDWTTRCIARPPDSPHERHRHNPASSNSVVSQARSCGRTTRVLLVALPVLDDRFPCARYCNRHRQSSDRPSSRQRFMRGISSPRNTSLRACAASSAEPEGRYNDTMVNGPKSRLNPAPLGIANIKAQACFHLIGVRLLPADRWPCRCSRACGHRKK